MNGYAVPTREPEKWGAPDGTGPETSQPRKVQALGPCEEEERTFQVPVEKMGVA